MVLETANNLTYVINKTILNYSFASTFSLNNSMTDCSKLVNAKCVECKANFKMKYLETDTADCLPIVCPVDIENCSTCLSGDC